MVKINELSELAQEAAREYKRAWNKANPEKVHAAQKRYWEKRGKKLMEERKAKKRACLLHNKNAESCRTKMQVVAPTFCR